MPSMILFKQQLNTTTLGRSVRYLLNIIEQQLSVDTYYTTLQEVKGIKVPSKTYGVRDLLVGIGGGIAFADFAYGTQSDTLNEIETNTLNEGKVVQVYKRFRIDGDITDVPFTMNETVQKQGVNSITGVVYGFHTDENYKYLDVRVQVELGQLQILFLVLQTQQLLKLVLSKIEFMLSMLKVDLLMMFHSKDTQVVNLFQLDILRHRQRSLIIQVVH